MGYHPVDLRSPRPRGLRFFRGGSFARRRVASIAPRGHPHGNEEVSERGYMQVPSTLFYVYAASSIQWMVAEELTEIWLIPAF